VLRAALDLQNNTESEKLDLKTGKRIICEKFQALNKKNVPFFESHDFGDEPLRKCDDRFCTNRIGYINCEIEKNQRENLLNFLQN